MISLVFVGAGPRAQRKTESGRQLIIKSMNEVDYVEKRTVMPLHGPSQIMLNNVMTDYVDCLTVYLTGL